MKLHIGLILEPDPGETVSDEYPNGVKKTIDLLDVKDKYSVMHFVADFGRTSIEDLLFTCGGAMWAPEEES
jgi:hypothetical protein